MCIKKIKEFYIRKIENVNKSTMHDMNTKNIRKIIEKKMIQRK